MRIPESKLARILAFAFVSIFLFYRATEAQTGARITFGINPTIFRAGQPASAELSVFAVSSSPLTLSAGSNFMFFLDSSLGTVQSATAPVAVESSSLLPGDFSVSFAGGQNPIIVTYNGLPKIFAFGDSFSVKINMIASAQPGPGKLSLLSQFLPSVNGALPFTTASIVDFANSGTSAITHDQTLIGDGTSAMPLGIAPGGVTTADLATAAVTSDKIAPGQVVKSLNDLFDNITLSAGANITLTPAVGNILTIAAPKALTAVSHDPSLTGDGTNGSPLRIASPPSIGAFFTNEDVSGGAGLDGPGRDVLSKTVPAGSYVIFARVDLSNIDPDAQFASCKLSTGAFTEIRIGELGGAYLSTATLLDVATFNSQSTITVHCNGFKIVTTSNGDGFPQVALTAIRVGSIQ